MGGTSSKGDITFQPWRSTLFRNVVHIEATSLLLANRLRLPPCHFPSSPKRHSLEEITHNQKLIPPLSTEPGHSPSTTLQSTEKIEQTQPTASGEAADDDQVEYPGGIHLLVVTIALILALLLAVMDMTILATAIPHITDEFHRPDDIGWYASVFFMTVASTQSTWGKAYKYFDLKTVFLIAIAIFELGSLVCGKPSSASRIDGYIQADVI